MKFIAVFFIILTGCVMTPKFDNVEYQQVVDIRILAENSAACNHPSSAIETGANLQLTTHYLRRYNEFSPRNQVFMEMIDEIASMITEFNEAYKPGIETDVFPSVYYCKAKLRIIERNLITLQQISRRKPER